MRYLLSMGAEVNKPGDDGDTALHVAVRRRDYEGVSLLLKWKAMPNTENLNGETPRRVRTLLPSLS